MPTYVLLSTLTAEGGATLHQNPDRLLAVNDEIRTFGCEVTAQYALLGQYDFMTVVEAPDNETIAHLSVDLGSRGTMKITTFPAMTMDALIGKLKSPEQIGRRTHDEDRQPEQAREPVAAGAATGATDAPPSLSRFID
jgi:uncharacterized protein with GYD domain